MKINGGTDFNSTFDSSSALPESPARLEESKLPEFAGTARNLCEVRDHRTDDPGFDVHVRDHRTDDPGFDVPVRDHRTGDSDWDVRKNDPGFDVHVRDHRTDDPGFDVHVRDHRTDRDWDKGFDLHVRDHRDKDFGGLVRDHRKHHTGSEGYPGERDHRTHHHHHHRGPIGDPTLAGEIRRLIGELERAIHGGRGSGETGRICTPGREPIDADKISFRVNNNVPLDADKISFGKKY